MKQFFTILALFVSTIICAQNANPWTDVNLSTVNFPESALQEVYPNEFRGVQLDVAAFQIAVQGAPMEYTTVAQNSPVTVTLPLKNGTNELFSVQETKVMEPGLAAKYPHFKFYKGVSVNNPLITTHFGYTSLGFHAVITTPEARLYIDPYVANSDYYMVTTLDDYNLEGPVQVKEYRMALACTGEYAQTHGGTVESVMASFAQASNRVNEIWEIEFAARLILIDNNEVLVFLDPVTDPYTDTNVGISLLGQNTAALNMFVAANQYDVGHVFTNACVDVGGVAGGTVCTNGKARGVTCHYAGVITIAENVMAHELAHQFSVAHTWNNCEGTIGSPPVDIISQQASGTAYEPGSGSTIMSYHGGCQGQNISGPGGLYYHVASIIEARQYIDNGSGNTCGALIDSDNHQPDIMLPYEDGFYIPISTPFELTAVAEDEDGDVLTYCWEQYNLGPISDLGSPQLNAPAFRSRNPTENPTRVFPIINNVIAGISNDEEVLPTFSRDFEFKCTVRDNHLGSGGVVWDEVEFQATDEAGPFLVMEPNSSQTVWEAGTYQLVEWDVANTDGEKVNCQQVNILLSVDNGFTYPYTLATSTANDGSQMVPVPNITDDQCRVKIQGSNNIFFDISNQNFSIIEATEPGYVLALNSPEEQLVCVPNTVELELETINVLDFSNEVTLEVIDGLPAGVTPVWSVNPVPAGESTTLTLDMSSVTADDIFELSIRATSEDADTIYQNVLFDVVYNNFDELDYVYPANGASNISSFTPFTWTELPQADNINIEIATSPAFGPDDIVASGYGITQDSFFLDALLEDNTVHYWRVQAGNVCDQSPYRPMAAFVTQSISCIEFESTDVPFNIPVVNSGTYSSELTILQSGTIGDVNISRIKGAYNVIKDIDVRLQSPAGTEVVLFSNICLNTTPFNLALDDEAPFEIDCPPNNGQAYMPNGTLADFDGEDIQGTWLLKITDIGSLGAGGGSVTQWGIESCASFEPINPYLVNNEVLPVPPNGSRQIRDPKLLSADDDNEAVDLIYTIVEAPAFGQLFFLGDQPLNVGDQFTQLTLNSGNVRYQHNGDTNDTDSFKFTVHDGQGGWIGITQFDFVIDPNAPTNTEELLSADDLVVFPNPTKSLVNVSFNKAINNAVTLELVNLQGQTVAIKNLANVNHSCQFGLENVTSGVYFLKIRTENGTVAKKLIVTK